MRTPLCDALGVEFPIVAFSHCRDVVAAVSKAGGFGVLGVTAFAPDQLETELSWIEDQVGGRPYGVDVIMPAKYVGSDQGGLDQLELAGLIPDEHRTFVESVLDRHGVPALPPGQRDRRGIEALSRQGASRLVDICLAHPIRVIANALGPPPPAVVEEAHRQGVLVAALVGNRQHALRQKAAGVDIIVAQGYEAGGHTGEIATMVLVPEIVDAVEPTPVLAAGGIATGRQVAAALALGAQGVWTGSVWLTTEEAETHPVVKEKFLRATSSDTVRSRATTGKPARQLRSAWTDEWESPDNPAPLPMPLQTMLIAEPLQRIGRAASAGHPGAQELINYFVGQVVGMMDRVRPARQVLFDMVDEYVDVAKKFSEALDPR